jgi:hypothetical protein
MVILFSKNTSDNTILSIEEIFNFLNFKNYIKLSQEDFVNEKFYFDLNNNELYIRDLKIDINEVSCLFMWKWSSKVKIHLEEFYSEHAQNEVQIMYKNLLDIFPKEIWFNSYDKLIISKYNQLIEAKKASLTIPQTFLINNFEDLNKIQKKSSNLITKGFETYLFKDDENIFINYTCDVNSIKTKAVGKFLPSLVQEKIEKKYEIRVIFLEGVCYSAAILSQDSNKTKTDFRNYDYENPNNILNYQLPKEIEHNISRFMNNIGLTFGSIDIIKSLDNKYYFLEVNPTGQFGLISSSCNYNINFMLANSIIKRHEKRKSK